MQTLTVSACRQTQVARTHAAEEALRDLRQQHEQMAAQLFSLNQQHQTLSDKNQEVIHQHQLLQQENAELRQTLQQQQADKQDEVSCCPVG